MSSLFLFMGHKRNFHHVHDVGLFAGIHVGIDTVFEIVSIQYLKGAEQAVPHREDVPIIGVGVWLNIMVVDFVHVGRYNEITDGAIEPFR